jgi:hypothetical protein
MEPAVQTKGKSVHETLLEVIARQDMIIRMLNAGLTREATEQLIKLNEQIRGFK